MTKTLTTEDRLEIADLFARYAHLVDSNQAAEWVALFTEDGAFDLPGMVKFVGKDLYAMPQTVAERGGGKWRHQMTNLVLTPGKNADEAEWKAYGIVTDWSTGAGTFLTFTDYTGTLRRVNGEWKIALLVANSPAPPPAQ